MIQYRNRNAGFLIILIAYGLSFTACKDANGNLSRGPGYLHAVDKKIADGTGDQIILKGIGLGGWMVQEGYMLGTSGPQHEIRNYLETMAGRAATDAFYESWLTDFVNQNDINQISNWGFNSVRLPMHYDLYFDEGGQWLDQSKGLELTDQLLSWCQSSKIYLILDMHAAPGGQGNNRDISDRRSGESLWENERFRQMTKTMWYHLADRYKNESWIGGYDLLNEPNYDFENTGNTKGCACKLNIPLRELFEELIDTVRSVDKNHLLIVEGNCYGSNYAGMESLAKYDKERNLAFSFHNYWGSNTPDAMKSLIDLRNRLNVPLWRGEIGENSNTWFTEMVQLMETYEIGYASWPWKKINGIDGPVFILSNEDWDRLMAFKNNKSNPQPSTTEAQNALLTMAESIKLKNTSLMNDVVYAYLNLPYGDGSKPYKTHEIPGIIYPTDYDYGRYGGSWYDSDYQNTSGNSSNTAWNRGESYRNDGVDIWPTIDPLSNGFFVGNTESGEFLAFTLSKVISGTYDIKIRVRANQSNEGKITLLVDNQSLTDVPIVITKSTGWKDVWVSNVSVPEGKVFRINFDQAPFDLASISFIN